MNIKRFKQKILIETQNVSFNDISSQISITVLIDKVDAYPVFSNGTYQVDITGRDYPLSENEICVVNFFGSKEKADRDNLLSKITPGKVWYMKGDYFIDPEDCEIRIFPTKYVLIYPLLEDGE